MPPPLADPASLPLRNAGMLALVPQMRGGKRLEVIRYAWERIRSATPEGRMSDAEDVLLVLAGQYYTVSELARFVGRDRMIESSLYTEALAEGLAAGEAKGRLRGEREVCTALVRKHHPAVFDRAIPIIDGCDDPARLKEWALAASDLSDSDFLKLLGA